MTVHHDLLEQARHLVDREPRRPKQASLRRAVSAAYYALFHLLVNEGTARIANTNLPALRRQVARTFAHADMKTICKQFSDGKLPPYLVELLQLPIQDDLRFAAKAFVDLQEARHRADYDMSHDLARASAGALVRLGEDTFAAWARVRKSANATVFLTALLLGTRWGQRG